MAKNRTQNTPATAAAGVTTEEKLDFKKLMPVFLVVLIDLLGLTIIIPLLPLYAASFGADPSLIGLLQAAYPTMQFIGAPILGRLSDQYGRKPVLIVSQLGTFIGFILLGFANGLPILFLSRIIDGLSGANISTAQAIISDSTTEKTRTQGLGLLGAAFGLGFIIGPLIAFAGLALSGNNYHIPAFIAAAFSALSIYLSATRLEETLSKDTKLTPTKRNGLSLQVIVQSLSRPSIGILLVLIFVQQIAFGGFEQFLALFTLSRLGLNASGNAIIFVFVGIIVVMVQGYFIGKWSKRFGDRRLIIAGLATLALGLALTALTPAQPAPWYSKSQLTQELTNHQVSTDTQLENSSIVLPDDTNKSWTGIAWLLVAMIPASIGGGILQPSINSLITKLVKPTERGSILGTSTAMVSAANVIGPLIGGLLFRVAISLPFFIWSGIMAVLIVVTVNAIKPFTSAPSTQVAATQN